MIPRMLDILVHVEEDLSRPDQEDLESTVREMHGVSSAHILTGNPHIMLMGYNPEWTSHRNIMGTMRDRGLHAQTIGFSRTDGGFLIQMVGF